MRDTASSNLVSIITVCLNSAGTLNRCITSVANQTYSNIEYIVIDGGSTDGTIGVIEANTQRIDYWISEPDRGISDAFNKGIALANGEYYLLLNADDWLSPNAIEYLLARTTRDVMVVCGSADFFEPNGYYLGRRISNPALLMEKCSVIHGACLIRRHVHKITGFYRLDRRLAMDHALFLDILSQFGPSAFATLSDPVINSSMGGESDKHALLGYHEVGLNLKEHGTSQSIVLYRFLVLTCKHYIARALSSRLGQIFSKLFQAIGKSISFRSL